MVEQRPFKALVVGSSPTQPKPPPSFPHQAWMFSLFFESSSHRPDAGESSFDIDDDLLR